MASRIRQTLERSPSDLSTRVYLTPREAVEYLGLSSLKALRCRMDRKSIPSWCWTRMGGSLRFLRASLDEWLQPAERVAAGKKARKPLALVHAPSVASGLSSAEENKVHSR